MPEDIWVVFDDTVTPTQYVKETSPLEYTAAEDMAKNFTEAEADAEIEAIYISDSAGVDDVVPRKKKKKKGTQHPPRF